MLKRQIFQVMAWIHIQEIGYIQEIGNFWEIVHFQEKARILFFEIWKIAYFLEIAYFSKEAYFLKIAVSFV
jgi:hypothetical protein